MAHPCLSAKLISRVAGTLAGSLKLGAGMASGGLVCCATVLAPFQFSFVLFHLLPWEPVLWCCGVVLHSATPASHRSTVRVLTSPFLIQPPANNGLRKAVEVGPSVWAPAPLWET